MIRSDYWEPEFFFSSILGLLLNVFNKGNQFASKSSARLGMHNEDDRRSVEVHVYNGITVSSPEPRSQAT